MPVCMCRSIVFLKQIGPQRPFCTEYLRVSFTLRNVALSFSKVSPDPGLSLLLLPSHTRILPSVLSPNVEACDLATQPLTWVSNLLYVPTTSTPSPCLFNSPERVEREATKSPFRSVPPDAGSPFRAAHCHRPDGEVGS